MEFSKELILKAKACKSEDEVKTLAKENGIELTDYEIKLILAEKAEGELADDELEAVSGGASGCSRNAYEKVYFNSEEEVQFIFNIGDVAQAFIGGIIGNETATVRITDRIKAEKGEHYWVDEYKYDRISGSPTMFGDGWHYRDRFER